tara:strand:- start:71 stop:1555 length:1485 start_codon:yes stop_codon:yes gene_type:complete
MESTFIFPNQLFYPHPAISKKRTIFLIQDPAFFYERETKLKFHKQKILLHMLSMNEYENELINKGYRVLNITFEHFHNNNNYESIIKNNEITNLHLCDVVDTFLFNNINNDCKKLGVKIQWYDSPSFLLNQTDIYNEFGNKKFHFMSNFYKKQRRRFNILMDKKNPIGGKWSYDTENRKKLPRGINIPNITTTKYDKIILDKYKIIISKYFNENPGSLSSFNFPINRSQAQSAFNDFLINRLKNFGDYEDAISSDETYLFHSILSPYLNIGLITPKDVIEQTLEFAKEHDIPLNSLEGFIRQIIGWREFIRGIYCEDGLKQRNTNYWSFNKTLPSSFYNAQTAIEPIDNTINRVINHAYCHHIERLMILGNIMVLLEISPKTVYQWFMEMFIDSYDWVMVPNVYGMSQFSDGGLMSTKPYISGSNYIIKMSDYKKNEWSKVWDALFWSFINKHRGFFIKNPRMNMMVAMYDKKNNEQKMSYNIIIQQFNKNLYK